VVQALTDAAGAFLGTLQFEGFPKISADGMTFVARRPQRVVLRDAANEVTFDRVAPLDPPIVATSMSVCEMVFPRRR
jgi:hypothetical protein